MGLGTAVRAEVCSSTIGMIADGVGSANVVVDTEFFAIGGTEAVVGDFLPR